MQKAYTKIEWENLPSVATPINATNLNAMSDALDEIDDRVVDMSESIAGIDSIVTRVSNLEDDEEDLDERVTRLEQASGGGTSVSATLLANGWDGTVVPAYQTLTIQGVTSTSIGFIDVAQSATTTQREAARKALLYISAQSTNTITVIADGDTPEVDIPVTVVIL